MNLIQEIRSALKQNSLRTILTGLSVSWGIFILIILLGAANGLKNAVVENMGDRAKNTVKITAWHTTKPYKDRNKDRKLSFVDKNMQSIGRLPETEKISAILSVNFPIVYQSQSVNNTSIKGVYPAYREIVSPTIKEGRFINEVDVEYRNKVIVLHPKIATMFFHKKSGIGEYVTVGGVLFRVIGVGSTSQTWQKESYIPYSTAQAIFHPNKKFDEIALTTQGLKTEQTNNAFDEKIQQKLANEMQFDPTDRGALWIDNMQKNYFQTMKIFAGLNLFMMLIGILTLIAGIVGVSNIMLVSVKERTREIGIRKAIGATPATILRSVLVESVLITAFFGYIGMLFGVGLIELIGFVMEQGAAVEFSSDGQQLSVFKAPTVEIKYIIISTLILILSGAIAGYIPAKKAVKIQPIEAMKEQ